MVPGAICFLVGWLELLQRMVLCLITFYGMGLIIRSVVLQIIVFASQLPGTIVRVHCGEREGVCPPDQRPDDESRRKT